jgi:hypothetical protein
MLATPKTFEPGLFSRARDGCNFRGSDARPHIHPEKPEFHNWRLLSETPTS